jgi:hypothetical protein
MYKKKNTHQATNMNKSMNEKLEEDEEEDEGEEDEGKGIQTIRLRVVTHDICGILYYVDASNNIYNPHQVCLGAMNPDIIATCKWVNGSMSIDKVYDSYAIFGGSSK